MSKRKPVRRILRCSRCGRSRFVQPEDGLSTCRECREYTLSLAVEYSDRTPITIHVPVTFTKREVRQIRVPVVYESGEPTTIMLSVEREPGETVRLPVLKEDKPRQ